MQYISATEARATLSHLIDQAQKEPVVIRRQQKDVAVMISPAEYQKLRGIQVQELDEICMRASDYARQQGLTEARLAQLLSDES